jgi:hypothetical protein
VATLVSCAALAATFVMVRHVEHRDDEQPQGKQKASPAAAKKSAPKIAQAEVKGR